MKNEQVQYGNLYWHIELTEPRYKDETTGVFVWADQIRVGGLGELIVSGKWRELKDDGTLEKPKESEEEQTTLVIAPGQWKFFHPANVFTDDAFCIDSWGYK